MTTHGNFLRWFLEKSENFSAVKFMDCKRWFFSIYNEKGDLIYLETYSDAELWNKFKEETK